MGWTKGSVKGVHRTYLILISPLGTKGRYGQARLMEMLKESIRHPLLSISPLGTKRRDGRAGLRRCEGSP